jgi:serine/threonine-protein kinase
MPTGEHPPSAEPAAPSPPTDTPLAGPDDSPAHAPLPGTRFDDEALLLEGGGATTEHMTLLPGYELLGLLGRGGTSVVYKARQSNLRRLVALKMILAGAHAVPEHLVRFRIEAETVAKLQHPNIVQIYEVGVYESCVYLALEHVEGKTLAEMFAGKTATPGEAARIVSALAKGVHHAHERGVVHRDLKPANVLMTKEGTPKIADFGLAKHVGSESMPSLRMSIQGTPSYMAPEQASLDKDAELGITMAVDIYALGSILYELLTGKPPFVGEDLKETVRRVLEEAPVPPRQLNPAVPDDLELICLKCLQKDPHQRYPTAEMLAEDLNSFLHEQPVTARPRGTLARTWRWARRHPVRATLAVFVLLLWLAVLGAAVGYAAWSHQEMKSARRARDQNRDELRQWQEGFHKLLDYNQTLRDHPNDLETLWLRAQLLQQLSERNLALADGNELLRRLPANDSRRKEVQLFLQKLQGAPRSGVGEIPD